MILNQTLGLRPIRYCINAARHLLAPCIKLSKDKFQISIDVRKFKQEELRVRSCSEYLIIEGAQESVSKNCYMVKQFRRKFRLPDGCDPSAMQTCLSNDGILTIVAPRVGRSHSERNPCEECDIAVCCSCRPTEPSALSVEDIRRKAKDDSSGTGKTDDKKT